MIVPQNEFILPTFLCFWLKLFFENFIKRIVVVGNNLFRQWRKCFVNKSEKNNNKFCLTFNNKREKGTLFSREQFYEVSANISLGFVTNISSSILICFLQLIIIYYLKHKPPSATISAAFENNI